MITRSSLAVQLIHGLLWMSCTVQYEYQEGSTGSGVLPSRVAMVTRDSVRGRMESIFGRSVSTYVKSDFFGGPCNAYQVAQYGDCDGAISNKKASTHPSSVTARHGQVEKACYEVVALDMPASPNASVALDKVWAQVDNRSRLVQVRNIFQTRCSSCHADQIPQNEDYFFRANSDATFVQMGLVVPKNPEASILYQRLTSTQSGFRMPPTASIPAQEVQVVRDWILNMNADPVSQETVAALKLFYPTLEANSELVQTMVDLRETAVYSSLNQPRKRALYLRDDMKTLFITLCTSAHWQSL